MAFRKITEGDMLGKGNVGRPDTPGVSTAEMQRILDELPREVLAPAFNELAGQLEAETAAADIGAAAPEGVTVAPAGKLQAVLNGLRDLVKAHTDRADNPHGVTAAQAGAYSKAETDAAISAKVVELGAGDMAKSIYDPGNEQQPLLPRNGDGSNVTVSFTEAEQDADIQTGEKLTVLFGKIKKRFSTYDADGDGVVDEAAAAPWSGITGKPDTFPPSAHNHDDRYYTETETDTKLAGKANSSHTHSKDQVGLGNVDNTADANKTVLEANRLKVRTTSSLVVTGGSGLYYYPANAQDLPPNNQDGLLLFITYGAWGGQLAFPTGGGVYYRYGTTTFSAWKRLDS